MTAWNFNQISILALFQLLVVVVGIQDIESTARLKFSHDELLVVPAKLHLEESTLVIGAKDFPVVRFVPICNQIDYACLPLLVESQKVNVFWGVDDEAHITHQSVFIRFKDYCFAFFTKLDDLCVRCAQ